MKKADAMVLLTPVVVHYEHCLVGKTSQSMLVEGRLLDFSSAESIKAHSVRGRHARAQMCADRACVVSPRMTNLPARPAA